MRDPINIPSAECLLFIRQLSDWRKKVTGVVRDAAQHHLVPLGYQQQQKSGPVIQVVSHSQAVGDFHYCQFELSAANDLFRKKKHFGLADLDVMCSCVSLVHQSASQPENE